MLKFIKKFSSRKRAGDTSQLDRDNIPAHVASIMDGNGRWAKKRGLPRSFGHKQGSENLRDIVRSADSVGVKMLTVYAFSTENWKRPADEVEYLMQLLLRYLDDELPEWDRNNVRLRFAGDTSVFSDNIRAKIDYDVNFLTKNTGMIFNIALNYGGRAEILRATRHLAEKCVQGTLAVENISEELFAQETYTVEYPNVDLLIRTSLDYRISNFLLWQCAYAEIIFLDTHFPDFKPDKFIETIRIFQSRHRRFGGL